MTETEKNLTDREVKFDMMAVSDLIPYARNSRKHSDEQVAQIASSIREFGFLSPVVVAADNTILAGHGRVMAAQKLGLERVPCVRAEHLTDAQKRAYVIVDNRLSETSVWDKDLLKLELFDLIYNAPELDLDEMGFSDDDLSQLDIDLGFMDDSDSGTEGNTDPDDVPDDAPAVAKRGQIWQLGRHRVMCGDSTSDVDVDRLMCGQNADMVFTDPPYGISVVPRSGKIGGSIKAKNQEYRPIHDDDKPFDPTFITSFFKDSIILLWGANYFCNKLPFGQWIVWDKGRPEGTTFSDCELAWTNRTGVAVKAFRVVWNGMTREGESGKRVHPTQKPILLCENVILSYDAKSIVDLFLGSGSTLIACEKTGRTCYGMEIDPKYVDVIIKRWEDFTGKKAELLEDADGQTTDN